MLPDDDSSTRRNDPIAEALCAYATSFVKVGRFEEVEAALAEAEAVVGISSRLRQQLLTCRAFLSLLLGDLDAAARAYEQLRKSYTRKRM